MTRLSLIFLAIIVLVGCASIANYMYANVFERRRQIGTLMALGAGSGLILRMFLLKALLLGLAGGIARRYARPAPGQYRSTSNAGTDVLRLGISVLIALAASYFPARRAARLDPCATLQEV